MADDAPDRPDPHAELRLTGLHAMRGANYWSVRPVTRMDLRVGAYEDISSADVPGFTDRLVGAMPGLVEHRCSIGTRGGFITRLRRGTYAPHIIEHVALELQTMVGHDVGFGRTRGGDEPDEYTLAFEHLHEAVGLRSAALALEAVQAALAGTLESVAHMTAELDSLARLPDTPTPTQHVLCGVTGGGPRAEARAELAQCASCADALVVDVSPAYILQQGLPYHRSDMAVILDAAPTDVPERYRDPERAVRLVSVVIDAVRPGGIVVCPAREWEIQDQARDAGCVVAVFSPDRVPTRRDRKVAHAAAWAAGGRIVLEVLGEHRDGGALRPDMARAPQLAARLAVFGAEGKLEPAEAR